MKWIRSVIVILGITIAGLLATGCFGDDGDNSDKAIVATAAPSTSENREASTPAQGITINVEGATAEAKIVTTSCATCPTGTPPQVVERVVVVVPSGPSTATSSAGATASVTIVEPAPVVAPPTAAPAPAPAPSGVCRLDKVATFAESAGGPQRIEAGGGGTQHIDFYPNLRINAVSYIVGPREPMIWMGFGSIWEGNGPECASFDYVADATAYATGRLNNGHSGLVIDLRSGSPQIVANVGGLSQDQIKDLLNLHRQAQAGNVVPSPTISGSSVSCKDGIRSDRQPVVGQAWTPQGEWRVVNFWTNEPGKNQSERKLLLGPSDNVGLLGGGASWSWPAACEQAARNAFANNGLPPVTLADLRAQGLVR